MSRFEDGLNSEEDRDVQVWLGEFLPNELPSDQFAASLKTKLVDERSSRIDVNSSDRKSPVSVAPQRSPWRRLSIGMVAAAAAVLVMVCWPAPVAYSFETMRARLNEQKFVRAGFVDQATSIVGWISSDGDFAAVESADSVSVSVRGKRVVRYTRRGGTTELTDDATASNDEPSSKLMRILGAVQADQSAGSSTGLSIISESWRHVSGSPGVDVELDVVFQDADLQESGQRDGLVPVRFGIDSGTGLPQWVQLLDDQGDDQATLSLGYPSVGPKDLSSLGIPDHLIEVTTKSVLPSSDSGDVAGKDTDDAPEHNSMASVQSPALSTKPFSETSEIDEPDADIQRLMKKEAESKSGDQGKPVVASSVRVWEKPIEVSVPSSVRAMSEQIDAHLRAVWDEQGLTPQPSADRHALFRRLHLDLTGRIPRVAEIRRQVTTESLAVEMVVESLLDSPDFDSNMAAAWTNWLLPPDVELEQFGGKPAFMAWLADQFAGSVPYDEIVRQLLTAEGRVGDAGPVLFTTALEMKPDHLAKQTARTFLGTRIDCAMCHDHPYDDWTQTDFWGYAALFARISRPVGKMNAMSSVLRVKDVGHGEVYLPDTEIAVEPKLLGGDRLVEEPESDQRRKQLAAWLTDPDNRQFSRATVNLVWSHFFGAGLVEPRDDFGVHNPSLSPELLEQLAAFFIKSKYDIRSLVRAIVQSDAYAQSSATTDRAVTERPMFDSMPIRWLSADQLYDCLQVASGGLAGSSANTQSGLGLQRIANSNRDQFIEQFGSPAGSVLDYQSGIPQALSLMNGPLANLAAGEDSSRLLKGLRAPFFSDRDRIETVFLSLVGRPASPAEIKVIDEMIEDSPDTAVPVILSDLVWALLNSAEFATNH